MADSYPIRFGRYELVEPLAVGGMAEVFLATVDGEHGFARKVVIKRLLPHLAREPGYTAMFIDEAKLTARLLHPKIAQTYELGRVGDQLFIAMEYVDGVDVLAMLREHAHRRDRIPTELAVWIAHEVLDALDYAHQLADGDGHPLGVVHRDISPSNVLLSRRGDVKLVDFGIARASEPGRHHRTKSGTLKGKYGYMSPEQVQELELDARSDLFSVGIVLAEMLCGRRLFAAPNELDVLLMVRDARLHRLDEHGKHLDRELDAILRRALRKDVATRWASAGEMRDALADWLFQQRLRVTPKRLGDAVEAVYDDVWWRRRAATAAEVPVDEVPEVRTPEPAAAPRPPPRAPTSAATPRAIRGETGPGTGDADGIPRGELSATDSLPIITMEEAPPVLEVMPPARAGARPKVKIPPKAEARRAAAPTRPPATAAPPARPVVHVPPLEAPAPRRAHPRARSVDERGEAPGGGGPAGSAGGAGGNAPRGIDDVDAAFADLELGEPLPPEPFATVGDDDPTPVPLSEEQQKSIRYASIEAAVSALSRDPDPSTVEFDGAPLGKRRPSTEMPAITEEELHRAATQPPPELAEIEETPEEHGDFATTPPLRLLYRLTSARRTGLLVTRVGGIRKEIYVRDGMPEYVSSNVSSELFGNWLVQQGVLSQGELAMALAMMPHYGGKLGDTLVGLGLLKPLEVFRNLTRQVRAKLIDVCTWTKGTYSWYPDRQNPREAFPLDLDAFEVLGAAAMALPDAAAEAWYERWGDRRLRSANVGKLGPERFELPGLRGLYDVLDGRRKVSELLGRYTDAAERARALRMLILLELCELARPGEPTRG